MSSLEHEEGGILWELAILTLRLVARLCKVGTSDLESLHASVRRREVLWCLPRPSRGVFVSGAVCGHLVCQALLSALAFPNPKGD